MPQQLLQHADSPHHHTPLSASVSHDFNTPSTPCPDDSTSDVNHDHSSTHLNDVSHLDTPPLISTPTSADCDGLFKTVDHHPQGKDSLHHADHIMQFTSNSAVYPSQQISTKSAHQQQHFQQHAGFFSPQQEQYYAGTASPQQQQQYASNNLQSKQSHYMASPEMMQQHVINYHQPQQYFQSAPHMQQQQKVAHPHQQQLEEHDSAMEDLHDTLMNQLDDMGHFTTADGNRMDDIDNEDYIDQYQKKRKRKASVLSLRGLSAKTVKQNNHERISSQTWMEQELQQAQNRANQFNLSTSAQFPYQHPYMGAFLQHQQQQQQQFDLSGGMLSASAPSVMSRDRAMYPNGTPSNIPMLTTTTTTTIVPQGHKTTTQDKSARGGIANFFSQLWAPKRKEDALTLPSDEQGSVSLTSKMVKYSVFTMDGLLWIRKFKCLALEVKVPFQIPDKVLPTIEYKLRVRQKDSDSYFGVATHEFVEYEFNGFNAADNVTTIPESAIDRTKQTLRIPFKLTKGQKDTVGGYKNIFQLTFIIRWGDNMGVTVRFSYRNDSRGKDEKNSYTRVSHICGHNQVWYQTTKGKENKVESGELDEDTPVIYMIPRIEQEVDDRGLKENKNQV